MAAVMAPAGLAAEERERPAAAVAVHERRASPAPFAGPGLYLAVLPHNHTDHNQYDDQHDHAAKVAI
jgi:hypothetical protein